MRGRRGKTRQQLLDDRKVTRENYKLKGKKGYQTSAVMFRSFGTLCGIDF